MRGFIYCHYGRAGLLRRELREMLRAVQAARAWNGILQSVQGVCMTMACAEGMFEVQV